jgi:hypothetical protein
MTRVLYVGSDVREPVGMTDENWSRERRETYLLRTNVARPLSLDRNVWCPFPSSENPLVDAPLPWVTVKETAERATTSGADAGRHSVLVIGVTSETDEDARVLERQGIMSGLAAKPGWTFLGFDVADGCTSGLSNCGYEADAGLASLRAKWTTRVNAHGLFADLSDALAFRTLTDQRVPEHAPFRVYGLWTVG